MKRLYYDMSEGKCIGVFVRDAQVIPAGTSVYSMGVKDKNEAYEVYAQNYDIHFIFDDAVPDVSFYTVPWVDIFATDSEGGFLGTIGQLTDVEGEAPICYIDRNGTCFLAAENLKKLMEKPSEWRRTMTNCDLVSFYGSKEEAEEKLEFIHQDVFVIQECVP